MDVLVDQAKMGVFGASLIAGAAGYSIWRFTSTMGSADPA